MTFKSIVGSSLMMLLILSAPVIAGAQTQSAERASVRQRGSEKYWLVGEFADSVVHFAYAKRFVQVHEGFLTDRQCQQYSRIAVDYANQLASVREDGVSAQIEFWNDVRAYSISMIGAPGVPIPGRTSKHWVTTGSEADDRELRRMVSLEIDEISSQLIRTVRYSPLALKPECRTALQEFTAKAQW